MQENNMNYPKFKVCVRCFTFNQAKYITDALNGFTMQQTDFPFVCCIVDDASTDGEQQVIMEYVQEHFDMSDASVSYRKETDYADITYAQHKENKNCYFAVLFLKENHYSQQKDKMPYLSEWRDNTEYEALCEGDDYWIHPQKLQMQVDSLDLHHEVDMCACGTLCMKDGKRNGKISPSSNGCILSTEDTILGGGGFLGTNSLLYRTYINKDDYIFWKYLKLDYFLQIHGSLRGGIFYVPNFMSVYRLSADNSWTKRMSLDKRRYFFHVEKVNEALAIFDYETDCRYHNIIQQKKSYNYYSLLSNGFQSGMLLKYCTKKNRLRLLILVLKSLFVK